VGRREATHPFTDQAEEEEEQQTIVGGKFFVDLTYGGVENGTSSGGGGGSAGTTSGVQDVQQSHIWENHVEDVIKSTRFLVNSVAAQTDRKEGDRLRFSSAKSRSAAR
jgi:hypothetical protein